MAIEVATGRWYPGRGDVSGGSATVPKPTIKAVAKEPEPEHETEEEDEEDEEEEKAHEPQICHWGACRRTYTGVDGAADLVVRTLLLPSIPISHPIFCMPTLTLYQNHISEDHVGHDDGYNPRCDFGSCGWTRKDRRDLLMAHVVRHIHDYKPLKCDQCDYSTKEARELVRHKKRKDHQ